MGSPTEFLTLNTSEWPREGVVCSLSQTLEVGGVPQRFFLSAKACAGILRRAEKRGKALPEPLRLALESAVTTTNDANYWKGCGSANYGEREVVAQPVAFDTYNQDLNSHVTHALRDGNSEGTPALLHSMQVRRLTPVECERLQGFPDGYTNIPWRKSPESPDGPRYKALGNSMAVPCMKWIGERIQQVSEI
jgi:site-specific DNA-cytosine methylase